MPCCGARSGQSIGQFYRSRQPHSSTAGTKCRSRVAPYPVFRPIELKRDNAMPETVARDKQTAKQTRPEAIGEVVGRIRRNVARAKAGKIRPEEFRTAVQMVIALHAQENTTIAGQARQAALGELFGLGHNYDKTFDARIEAVRLQDVVGAARSYLNNYLPVTTSPQEQLNAASGRNGTAGKRAR